MGTPHIAAERGAVAKTVLLPGDPKRSRYIAQNYLTDAVLFTDVRGIQGYTGLYKGTKISVMASGMGCASMGIYAHELCDFYEAENLLRVGTIGSLSERAPLRTLIMAMSACTDTNFAAQFALPGTPAPTASWELLRAAAYTAGRLGIPYEVGCVLTSDYFYTDTADWNLRWRKLGILGVEMETAALYLTAMRYGKRALSLLTVSDELLTGARMTPEERETSLDAMLTAALELARTL